MMRLLLSGARFEFLQEVQRVLHAGLHARLDDRVAVLLARSLHEDRGGVRPSAVSVNVVCSPSSFPLRTPFRQAFVGLGRDDPLVGTIAAVFAVETDFESASAAIAVPPRAADLQVDSAVDHLAPLRLFHQRFTSSAW